MSMTVTCSLARPASYYSRYHGQNPNFFAPTIAETLPRYDFHGSAPDPGKVIQGWRMDESQGTPGKYRVDTKDNSSRTRRFVFF